MTKVEKLLGISKKYFESNEEIVHYIYGAYEKVFDGKNTLRTGILIATNKRIVFCGKRFFTVFNDIVEYEDVYNVELSQEKFGYKVFIHCKKQSCSMRFVEDKDVIKFAEFIKENKGKRKQQLKGL